MRIINTEKIKELLQKKGTTQKHFSQTVGVKEANISRALKGNGSISMNYVFDIANYFKVSPLSLTIDNNTKQSNTTATQQGQNNGTR